MKAILNFIFLFALTFNSYALSFNVGTYVPYLGKVQDSTSGSRQKYALNPSFSLMGSFQAFSGLYFNPEIGYVYHRDVAADLYKQTIFILYSLVRPINSIFVSRFGLGTNWTQVKGDGGIVYLNNGDGVSPYARPDKSSTTYYSYLLGGIEAFVQSHRSIRFDLQMMAPLDSERRSYNYLLTFNFYH